MASDQLPQTASFRTPQDASVVTRLGAQPGTQLEQALANLVTRLEKPKRPKSVVYISLPDKGPPRIAAWQGDDEHFVASMAKLALGVAALQLRDDLRASADLTGARTLAHAWKGLKDHWAKSPSDLVRRLARMSDRALPDYKRVFDPLFDKTHLWAHLDLNAASGDQLDGTFVKDDFDYLTRLEGALHSNTGDTARYRLLAGRPFLDVLHLALRWSDNWAATACIDILTVNYIMTCITQLGLFIPSSNRGLHLGGWYAAPADTMSIKPVSVPVVMDWKYRTKGAVSGQATTGRASATLLASLSRGLVVPNSAPLFRAMLDNTNGYYHTNGMLADGVSPPPTQHLSKIGIFSPRHPTAERPEMWHDSVAVRGTSSDGRSYGFACSVIACTSSPNLRAFGKQILPLAQREGASNDTP